METFLDYQREAEERFERREEERWERERKLEDVRRKEEQQPRQYYPPSSQPFNQDSNEYNY